MSVQISASQVKELRDRTGVGMAKCKEALEEAKGDMEQAIAILRKAGMASAVKKQGRETKEGAILVAETANALAICEVNAETDFVVKNDRFQEFARNVAEDAAKMMPASLDDLLKLPYSKDASLSIDQYRSLVIQTIGENIQISRVQVLKKNPNHSYGIYSHMGGKILTLVELSAPGEEALARDIAMHVAAANPEYLYPQDVPQEIVEREKEIARGQVQGKPANIMDKIIEGKVNAYFDLVCLARQKYVRDDQVTIEGLVKKRADAQGKDGMKLVSFVRWMVGA